MNLVVLAAAASLFAIVPATTAREPVIPQPKTAGEMPVVHPDAAIGKTCPATSRYEAARRGGQLKLQLLNQLPAADMYKAVYRRIDGCNAPIIARSGIGGR